MGDNENDLLLEINRNIIAISEEVKEKKIELENVKFVNKIQTKNLLKQQKGEYNKDIKEYHNLIKLILAEEQKLEEFERSINKIRYKQKMTVLGINEDFVKHFNDYTSRLQPEIIEGLIEFFGYSLTPYGIFKVRIKIIFRK